MYKRQVEEARANGTIREKSDIMFPKGDLLNEKGYSGAVYKNKLVENETTFNCPEVDKYNICLLYTSCFGEILAAIFLV